MNGSDEAPNGGAVRVRLEVADPLSRAGLMVLLAEAGIEVTAEIEPSNPAEVVLWDADAELPAPERSAPLLALTNDLDRSAELMAAGADGVLSRRSGAARLAAALQALANGLGVLPAATMRTLLAPVYEATAALPLEPLTPRERQVLELLADGLTNRAIAEQLDIGPSTVKFHLAALLGKFAAATRTELVVRAIRSGEILI